ETKLVRKQRNDVAKHVSGRGKAVQQQDRRRLPRSSLAVEYPDAIDIDLPISDGGHENSFRFGGSTGLQERRPRTSSSARSAPASGSQIDDDVTTRLRATNEKVAIGGHVEWLRFIRDLARDQTAFAVVTNAAPARPTDGDVASLGQLQDA